MDDIKASINDAKLKQILLQSVDVYNHKKFTTSLRRKFKQIINENINNISYIDTFLSYEKNKKTFGQLIGTISNGEISVYMAITVYKKAIAEARSLAQKNKFSGFLYHLQIGTVLDDYFHIKYSHIDGGDRQSMENVLTFFENAIHWNDYDLDHE